MPKIIGQAEQLAAMKNIKAALKEMTVTNAFLEASNPSGEYIVSFKDRGGHTISTTVYSADKQVIDTLAQAYKKQVVDDMMHQAEINRIELDPEELAIFGIV